MEEALIEDMIILDSKQESINKVTSFVDEIDSTSNQRFKDAYGNIIIALTEAVNNAINHGNKNDPDKKVIVKYRKTINKVFFTVEDEGDGFDYDNIPDPTAPENIEKTNGRGVFLMRNLVDDITFHENGKKIELIFNCA